MADGGYDDGYNGTPCLWGREPGSLIREFLKEANVKGWRVADLGCGEGKNAFALATAGALVDAVDISALAIEHGRRQLDHPRISWVNTSVQDFLCRAAPYDVIVMYGLPHCLPSRTAVAKMIKLAKGRTRPGGLHFLVAFDDGPHDLSAHPSFTPCLLPHAFYRTLYQAHELISCTSSLLYETHPHNNIPHFHSVTRLVVRI